MIGHLSGLLLASTPAYAIVDVNGIGYKVYIALSTYGLLPALGSPCRLWIAHLIREQSETLYGFLQQSECTFFETLITVNGIGPKLALSILGHLGYHELLQALASGDIAALSSVPGIGKKTAQRLLVELRDKAGATACLLPSNQEAPVSQNQRLATSALINLGYSETVAQRALKKCSEELQNGDVASLIAAALRQI